MKSDVWCRLKWRSWRSLCWHSRYFCRYQWWGQRHWRSDFIRVVQQKCTRKQLQGSISSVYTSQLTCSPFSYQALDTFLVEKPERNQMYKSFRTSQFEYKLCPSERSFGKPEDKVLEGEEIRPAWGHSNTRHRPWPEQSSQNLLQARRGRNVPCWVP
jgi:hypothetical protein